MKKEDYIDIKDMQTLVLSWQEKRDRDTLGKILYYFESYIEKYAKAMKSIGYVNSDVHAFLRLFGKSSTDEAKSLLKEILKMYTYEDLKSELTLIFIDTLKRYKYLENGPMFPGFLKSYYKFKVKNWIDKISRNPLNKLQKYSFMEDGGKENYDEENYNAHKEEETSSLHSIVDKTVIEEFQLNLFTQETFKRVRQLLDERELMIVQQYYVEHRSRVQIMQLFGISRKEFNTIHDDAVEKLRTFFKIDEDDR